MKEFEHKSYKLGFIIGNRRVGLKLKKAMARAFDCVRHNMNYDLYDPGYRRYRRGKNRCVRCGLKVR